MQWYYEKEREQNGPVDENELKQLFDSGLIDSSNLVWSAEMKDWATYGSVFGTAETAAATAAPAAAAEAAPARISGTGGETPNAELRAQARNALSGSWGMAALAVFLLQAVLGAVAMVPLLGLLAQIAISGAMMVGVYAFFTQLHRSGVADVGVLFEGFSQFWHALGIYLLSSVIIFAASFVAAIPGVVFLVFMGQAASVSIEESPLLVLGLLAAFVPLFVVCMALTLRYAVIYFIARDQPELGVAETLRTSAEMMKGRKLKLFFLGLSFIGWHILGMMALFIGIFWSSAYMFAAFAAFYDDLQEA
ncbi:MAG: DUF975 family protein [Opitutales bacterium]